MTKQPKSSPDWYIAATHYLTADFAVPFLINIIIGFILVKLLGEVTPLSQGISLIVAGFAVWLGVMYSARFLKKAYIISDPKKIVLFSTSYYVVLFLLFLTSLILTSSPDMTAIAFSVASGIVGVVIFYVASIRYVKAAPVNAV